MHPPGKGIHAELCEPLLSAIPLIETHSSVYSDPNDPGTYVRLYSVCFHWRERPLLPLVFAEPLSTHGAYWNGIRIFKENGAVLLNDGDRIGPCPKGGYVFRTSKMGAKRLSENQKEEARVYIFFCLSIMRGEKIKRKKEHTDWAEY